MHASLRLENLSKLPRDIRKTATAAAGGDLEELWTVYDMAQSSPILEFLPVYYAGLEISPIPELLARFDSSSTSADVEFFDDKISRACLCLQLIVHLDEKGLVPVPVAADLWPRVWPWLDFIDSYWDHIPEIKMLENRVLYYNAVLSILLFLRRHTATAAAIDATPGVRIIAVRIWALYLQDPEIAGKNKFGRLCGYIQSGLDLLEDRNFGEAIDGAGGSRTALAALALKHIIAVGAFPSSNNTVYCLKPLLTVLHNKCKTDPVFTQALIEQGVVTTLTATACLLTAPHFNEDIALFDTCFSTIIAYIMVQLGHNLVTEALRAGLLHAFFSRAQRPCSNSAIKILESALIIFTASVVYLSVLKQLLKSIKELDFVADSRSLRGFALTHSWEPFWWMLKQRSGVMEDYLEREPPLRACDNLTCGAVRPKTDFLRCAGCLTLIYCSRQCQAIDWKRGGHREACGSLLHLRLDEPKSVSSKDKSFLRYLIHAEYAEQKKSILTKEVHALRATSLAALPVVRFDYSRPYIPCSIDVGSPVALDAKWSEYVSRATNSRGRLRLHTMQVTDGGLTREWMFPLRHATEEMSVGVQLLAMNQTIVGPEIGARVQFLMDMKDIVEIH
ncbi:hypothetical protein C8R47DRAFT_111084 [Mycena vitilis]|nr:hypothetical protein C8R47DRAFT_111084 [Mycena vitilis]